MDPEGIKLALILNLRLALKKGDTDIDTLMSEILIPMLILILFRLRILILIQYPYDSIEDLCLTKTK